MEGNDFLLIFPIDTDNLIFSLNEKREKRARLMSSNNFSYFFSWYSLFYSVLMSRVTQNQEKEKAEESY